MQIIGGSLLWTSSQMEESSRLSKTSPRNSGKPQETLAKQSFPQAWCVREGWRISETLWMSPWARPVCSGVSAGWCEGVCWVWKGWEKQIHEALCKPLAIWGASEATESNFAEQSWLLFYFHLILTGRYLKRAQQEWAPKPPGFIPGLDKGLFWSW